MDLPKNQIKFMEKYSKLSGNKFSDSIDYIKISSEGFHVVTSKKNKSKTKYKIKELKDTFWSICVPDILSFQIFKPDCIPCNFQGVYCLSHNKSIFYIGQSIDIKNRMIAHKLDYDFDEVLIKQIKEHRLMCLFEMMLIKKYKPLMNRQYVKK